ncbi:hypothetical protein DLM_0408 [Aquitalea magnusonii]|uniref:Uncharacterized protein n=1 Tax=Aquitalea magnusonii TaxID=332411 RepID=A0A3G9G7Q8_9NEIS|nr:hypothetical protein DLM_0408 [Aquitalea magnusonii]
MRDKPVLLPMSLAFAGEINIRLACSQARCICMKAGIDVD